MNPDPILRYGAAGLLLVGVGLFSLSLRSDPMFTAGDAPTIAQVPLYIRDTAPPLNMLVMGKDHKIYYEAYNDASDLDGDGLLDVGYRGWERKSPAPAEGSPYKIDYYGYFDSFMCYDWDGDKFVPGNRSETKTCNGRWSGDFLNYATMSRMDVLRRVLYGGWRATDTEQQTILQGAFFPQDAHSWGKEYQSVARDGYDIRQYTPLPLPGADRYHLFAVTTFSGNFQAFPNYHAPRFRVLRDTTVRVWNWVAMEGPVAGNRCGSQSTECVTMTGHPGHPANRGEFDTRQSDWARSEYLLRADSPAQISCDSDCGANGQHDNYMTIITGEFRTGNNARTYQFSIDGDDAVDFRITQNNGTAISGGDRGWYGGHGSCNSCDTYTTGEIALPANTTYRILFRHEEAAGGDNYRLRFRSRTGNGSWSAYSIVPAKAGNNPGLQNLSRSVYTLLKPAGASFDNDRFVRVLACPATAELRDASCKTYPAGTHKPVGILHDYGENQRMYFGLVTGTQRNNLQGGVLRRNIENFADEVDASTGVFRSDVEGIARSIDRLRMIGGGYATGGDNLPPSTNRKNWNWANEENQLGGRCVSQGGRSLENGECRMWGNPIAEMMFESVRYFAGASGPTTRFTNKDNTHGTREDTHLGLPEPAWKDPYIATARGGGGYPSCSRPVMTVISDINPSYDGDLPGSAFATVATDAALDDFNAAALGQEIWSSEFGSATKSVFIGEVAGTSDGAPTAKSASSFGNIRGLAPEEPTKEGTYYSASVARYAATRRLNAASDAPNLTTYSVALASPLPRMSIPVGSGRTVELLPFAKTVSGTFGENTRKPTNTIVDFFVESIANFPGMPTERTINGGRPYAVFRINYEDVEQGNDHDMDMIVGYEISVGTANNVTVKLTSEYAAGSANQIGGYVISGTTQDGVYLEVRDTDAPLHRYQDRAGNAPGSSAYRNGWRPYALNTPEGRSPGYCNGRDTEECGLLPLESTRVFTPGSTGAGEQLRDPLWYAAKYGTPGGIAVGTDGEPENYFLVSNPLNLRSQLAKAFDSAQNASPSPGSATISGARVGASTFTLEPRFRRDREGNDWTGNLTAYAIRADGSLGTALWNAQGNLPAHAERNIRTIIRPGDGTSSAGTGIEAANFVAASLGAQSGDQLGRLGVNPANVAQMYGANYAGADFVAYLRGDQSREAARGGAANTLRTRSSVIGSIVNSEPVIAAPRSDLGYGNVYRQTSDAMFAGYASNADGTGYLDLKRARPAAAYVGANDGMLHAFNAGTTPCVLDPKQTCAGENAGRELFAFIPNAVIGNLGLIPVPDKDYVHRYYVDGQIAIGDVKHGNDNVGNSWRTVLVGSTGGGARSIFALDVTNPSQFGDASVLWERNSTVDSDIGHIYGKPLIVPLENGRWGAVFGNGYGGRRGDPSLYVLDAMTGQIISKLTADDGEPARQDGEAGGVLCALSNLFNIGTCGAVGTSPYNGLGQITAIDSDGDGKVDTVYGGDLQGNLWKFDLDGADVSRWGVANGGAALFTAKIGDEPQPITGGMRVAAGPGTGVMVYFGTGRYLFAGDNDVPESPTVQSLYAVFDNGTPVAGGRSALQAQVITGAVSANGTVTRNISRSRVVYNGPQAKRGWYLDLEVNTAAANETPVYRSIGERFIATPRIQSGRVFFTTFTPSEDSCNPGGDNFVYGLDLLSGSGALTNVQVQPSQDPACTGADCGAIRHDQGGAPVTSTSVAAFNALAEITGTGPGACTPGVDCPTFEQCQVVVYPGAFVLPRPCGRQSWRQLR